MKVPALFCMGLALVGVTAFNVVAADQDQDDDHQKKPHQKLNHPASTEVMEIQDEQEYSQLLDYLKNVTTGRKHRQTPRIREVKTFYEIPIGSDYEVKFNFSVNPVPIAPFWTHGPIVFQIGYLPRDIGRFSTSMTYYTNDSYQTVLRITGITKNDIETNFDLHITNGIDEAVYRVILSELPGPPSSVQISNVMPESVSLSWEYNFLPGNISSYVIQYKPRHTNQNYNETVNIHTMFHTIKGLTPSTEYDFRVLAVNQFGRGLPSENAYNTTRAVETDDLPVTTIKPTDAPTSKQATQHPTTEITKWHQDLRCGSEFPLSDGQPSHCDPSSEFPCCSLSGWCGNTRNHCICVGCIDYNADEQDDPTPKEISITTSTTLVTAESTDVPPTAPLNPNTTKSDQPPLDMCATAAGEFVNGKCLTFNRAGLNWSDAKDACATNGWLLASFDDTEAVYDYITTNHPGIYFWTGGSDTTNEGTFTWLDGRTFVPSPWYPNRPWATPAEGNPYDCIEVVGGGGYGDYACSAPRAYICEGETCSVEEFRCDSGICISQSYVCDGNNDCPDEEDEQDCQNTSCNAEQFGCSNGLCIDHNWQCDGENDCLDGDDEKDCQNNTCSVEEFRCHSEMCISQSYICDDYNDCPDGDDEQDCQNYICSVEEFRCHSGMCISQSYVCDDYNDCPDGDDEQDCQNCCVEEYTSSSGMIRHPLSGGDYHECCNLIIRTTERITIIFTLFEMNRNYEILNIRDGSSSESPLVGSFSGSLINNGSFPSSVTTSSTAAHLFFTSDYYDNTDTRFELHWEPAVVMVYQVPIGSDYVVRLNFSVNPGPTDLEWSYGPNFQEMTNIIQIPSDNIKFFTYWIDLQDNNYQTILKITGITQNDFETKFKLHVTNGINETNYRVMLSAFPRPPSIVQVSDRMPEAVRLSCKYNFIPGSLTYYLIQYKPWNATDQDYIETPDIQTMFYVIRGLTPSTQYAFRFLAGNQLGRGSPSEKAYFTTTKTGCGGEYTSSSGMIRHPLNISGYQPPEMCTWIIKTTERITVMFTKFEPHLYERYFLDIRDGSSRESALLGSFSESLLDGSLPSSVTTSSTAAHMVLISDGWGGDHGFELHWETKVETFYHVPIGSDYEVLLNFSADPRPTALEWSYGTNFQKLSNIIQIPSHNGKFSSSLIVSNDLENNNYQALLMITGITQYDFETNFMLHVTNGIGETSYRVMLSGSPGPPSSVQISYILGTTVRVAWDYNDDHGNISYYVIQYKPWNTKHNYTEMSGIDEKQTTLAGLTPSMEYMLHVVAVDKFGHGQPSEPRYFTTMSCGGEYNSSSWSIRHPLSARYQLYHHCTWIIRTAGPSRITFNSFDIGWRAPGDYLYIYDGLDSSSEEIGRLTGSLAENANFLRSITSTSNALLLNFTLNYVEPTANMFELHWEPAEVVLLVNPGERVNLECGTKAYYRYCIWEKDTRIIQVEDVHNGLYSGLERPNKTLGNECGIVLSQASMRDNGTWTCNIYIPYSRHALLAITKIIHTVAPSNVEVSPLEVTVNNDKRIFVRCLVKSSRPAVQISWTLNGKNLSSSSRVKEKLNNYDGTFQTSSTLSHIVSLTENGQLLKCEVAHHALVEPEILSVPIIVSGFDPVQKPGEIQIHYNISLNSNHEIYFTFSVSPQLTSMRWYYGTNFQERSKFIVIPSETDKYSASFINLNNGIYGAILKISSVTKEDLKNKLILHIANGKDEANYRFMLSTDGNPFECSAGFVMSYDAKHCYKIFNEERNFTDAQKKCIDDGLMPVQLSDENAADVRNMLLDEYGDGPVWLNARGNNSAFVWSGTQTQIRNGSHLWWPKSPGDWVGTDQCLLLLVYGSNFDSHPGKPYRPFFCRRKLKTICEGDTPKPKKTASITAATKQLDEFCTGGWFFTSRSSFECYVYFHDTPRSWEEARGMCEEEGLLTAKPSSGDMAIEMRKYLLEKYGDGRVWLGARANGTHYHWEQDNTQLDWSSSLWEIGRPEGDWDDCWQLYVSCQRGTSDHCLTLRVTRSEWIVGPDHPYASDECSTPQYALCQRKAGCPADYFTVGGIHHCFKLFDEVEIDWTEAASKCRDEGLRLAQPSDETALAIWNYISDTKGGRMIWLGARRQTPASEVLWQHHYPRDLTTTTTGGNSRNNSTKFIPRTSSLWQWIVDEDDFNNRNLDDHCLVMDVQDWNLKNFPDQPYSMFPCLFHLASPLCEVVNHDLE